MTGRGLLSAVQRLLAGIVLVLSGGYMLIYLYRWEWNRAIISGLFFVAAEVALAASMVLRRLRRLEERTTSGVDRTAAAAYEQLRHAEVDRPNPFRWLTAGNGSLPVLVPVLLGAGAVLSAIAYVVERVAEATAFPAFDRRVAHRLAVIAPPPGGLLDGPLPPPAVVPNGSHRTGAALIRVVVGVVTAAVLAWFGGNALVEGAQSRPDPADRPARTSIDLTIASRDGSPPPITTAEALWVACRSTIGDLPATAEVLARGEQGATLVLRPGIGRLGVRRLTGCLGDVRLDLVRADVISASSVPS
jgi:hypothetical protein